MAIEERLPFAYRTYTATLADISTAGSAYCAAAGRGKLVAIIVTIANAITVANSALSTEINGVAVTGGTGTMAFTGSGIGTSVTIRPTALNDVNEGDLLELITDGGSTTTAVTAVTFVVREF